jgi:tetratricopeptide (TPR) repeat protein
MSRKKRRRRSPTRSAAYQQALVEVDRVLQENGAEVRADNWEQLVLEWVTPVEPDRGEMTHYMTEHRERLGVPWALDALRFEILYQNKDHLQICNHFDLALSRYPRCAVLELWAADVIFRHGGDFWRARPMYLWTAEQLPSFAKPAYELGFMNYLLGDFPGALHWFDLAATRLTAEENQLGASLFYNRGLTHLVTSGDRKATIADIKQAIQLNPDHAQARTTLRALQRKAEMRWVPW